MNSYIIGKNTNYFKNQVKNKINCKVVKNLKNSLIELLKDIQIKKTKATQYFLSPAAASYDQFDNFEKRGDEFKKLSRFYARKSF